jgi:hypothetical protein
MSRFYFHIIADGRTIPDEEGMELPNLLAAQEEAMASARELSLESGSRMEKRTVQIVDGVGRVLGTVPVFDTVPVFH